MIELGPQRNRIFMDKGVISPVRCCWREAKRAMDLVKRLAAAFGMHSAQQQAVAALGSTHDSRDF